MKTIDEMLDEVAKNLNNKHQNPSGVTKQTDIPKPSVKAEPKSETVHKKHECTGKCNGNCSCKKHGELKKYPGLTLDFAKEIAYCIEKGAKMMGVSVVISIVNEGANPVLLNAMDESFIISSKAAQEKAYTAMALKMPTHAALKESRGGSLDGLTNGNGILLIPGGCPLMSGGKIYGAVGVSGGSVEEDKLLSMIGCAYFDARMKL